VGVWEMSCVYPVKFIIFISEKRKKRDLSASLSQFPTTTIIEDLLLRTNDSSGYGQQ
jgi:hypothetical protein